MSSTSKSVPAQVLADRGTLIPSATPTAAPHDVPIVRIGPTRGWASLGLGELRGHHELLYFLVWRSLKVRYRQTVLGAAWAIIQPLFTMGVFTIFFGRLAKVPSDGIPYPIFVYAALVPWMYFANAVMQSSNTLLDHERMVTKIYFPRLLLPLASVLSALVDFIIAFGVLLVMMLWYRVVPTVAVFAVPFLLLLGSASALAAGLWLSAINVKYRDVRQIVPFLMQVWLFVTPVVYPSSLLPAWWRPVYGINPMVGVVDGFRWALLGGVRAPVATVLVATIVASVALIGGLYYFRRMEQTFADVI